METETKHLVYKQGSSDGNTCGEKYEEIGGRFVGYWYQANNKFIFSGREAVLCLKEVSGRNREIYL